jgi:GNAT superfamily N-acetyltransferase
MALTISTDPDRIDRPTLYAWLGEAYWSKNRSVETIEKSIRHSDVFVAFEDDKMVGFARVVTDRASFAWLCDVYVGPESRGKGVSKALVEAILANPEYETVRWMLATRDAHGLYEKYGFTLSTETDRWMTRGFNVRPPRDP